MGITAVRLFVKTKVRKLQRLEKVQIYQSFQILNRFNHVRQSVAFWSQQLIYRIQIRQKNIESFWDRWVKGIKDSATPELVAMHFMT